ncbi:MAG: hypothetical protein JWN56_2140 [Sphingobacteriales bacterium]|nr:hypothetical protein [Sphingobacteriales bacterium]
MFNQLAPSLPSLVNLSMKNMGLLRLLVTGAAVAAGVHYVTKKRADGSSIADDLKAKAPEYMDKAKPYINQLKNRITQLTGGQPKTYPQKFDDFTPDPDPTYSS